MARQEELTRDKVIFILDSESSQKVKTESLWAEKIDDDTYRIVNNPFFIYGVSFDDIIGVSRTQNKLYFTHVKAQGGHSTYRLFLKDKSILHSEEFLDYWSKISELGGTYENANGMLISVDIPPGKDIMAIYALFERGEADNLWIFEEANYEKSSVVRAV